MAFFGKNEEELKKWQLDLDGRENTLNRQQVNLGRKENELDNLNVLSQEKAEELTKKDSDLAKREKDISQRELNAKNDFVKEQRKVFKEAIEVRLKGLDERAKELDLKQDSMEQQFAEWKSLEGRLAKRERVLKESELNAKNGFAEQNKISLQEIEKRDEACIFSEGTIKQREEEIGVQIRELEKKSEQLRTREKKLKDDEIRRDEGFSNESKSLDNELFKKKNEFLKELSVKRENEFNSLEKSISSERRSRLSVLQNELSEERQNHDDSVYKNKNSLRLVREHLATEQDRLEELKEVLEYQNQRLQTRSYTLEERELNINSEVDVRVGERKKSFEIEKGTLNDEVERLRESIRISSNLISNFEELKQKLGNEDPAVVLQKLKTYEEEIARLRDDLATRPTQEMQESFDRMDTDKKDLQSACDHLSEENRTLRGSYRIQSELEVKLEELKDKNKSLSMRYESVDADNNRLMSDLKRLQSSYEREQDREARIRDIEAPYIQKDIPRSINKVEEIQWLDGISESCIDYGLKFPRRILHAFHTALKTSEWSPITVLAGVSGTGKSELPRLYSHFGGLNFLNLSVQPNWDSQESMLGFFNSIDNKFDAQPILRLLAQSQKSKSDEYPFGFDDVMNLILMDEMNLAHVELYFADFLSKLELRRGLDSNNLPSLEVKLGAGVPHYDLPLGRNVLWTGTMNQDETTKSLSDKVLDRGIVINFPRPISLERRKSNSRLSEPAPLLSKKVFQGWWCKSSQFSDEQILPYKGFIEEMNTSLSNVGRAMGHRVWQSIEYYMSNYPDVMEAQRNNDDISLSKAMKIAFEDQLVQKVMPKLRGIETRGKSKTDCLDKIRSQLVNDDYTIVEDFDLASEFGYGQFIWSSANYLKEDAVSNDDRISTETLPEDSISASEAHSEIPGKLLEHAEYYKLELWSFTKAEIKNILGCTLKDAQLIKTLVNKTKDN